MSDIAHPDIARRWFITGASSGFGREIARAAAERGERVIATGRNPHDLVDLVEEFPESIMTAPLDVTDADAVTMAVDLAQERLGGIDVVVNNAGYSVLGGLEELSEEQIRRQLETNLIGVVNVTRAVLPMMRAQGSGHLLQMSSISGAQPWTGFSAYVASKHAVEGLSSSLATEVEPLGLKVTIVEPGPFRTDFFIRSMERADPLPEYEQTVGQTRTFLETFVQPGDPKRAAQAILAVVDADEPPLRLALGAYAVEEFRAEYAQRLSDLDAWEELSRSTDFPSIEMGAQ